MKKLMILFTTMAVLFSCSDNDDQKVEKKDYGTKTFSADLKYDKNAKHGEFNYKQQVYFAFGKKEPIALGEYGEKSWTTFNILPKVPENLMDPSSKIIDNVKYNVTTNVKDWDLLFTQYIGNGFPKGDERIYPYHVAGVLINRDRVKVGVYENEELKKLKDESEIEKTFSNLKLSDVKEINYSDDIDVIGYSGWKTPDKNFTYNVNPNYFYVVKTNSGDYYKLHFLSFYGKTKDERIITCEYALMK